MNSSTQSLIVGIVAGLASALLVMGSGSMSALSVMLSAAAVLPVLIAGLGWSNLAGAAAAATGTLVIAAALSPLAAAMVAVTTLAPAAWIAHLSNLARPAEELGGPQGKLAWYPLSDIMLHICGLVSASVIIVGYAVGYGEALVSEIVDSVVTVLDEQNPEIQFDKTRMLEMITPVTRVLPALHAFLWVIILFTAWYIACGIARLSGRAKRPADVIPTGLRMSRLGLLIFGAGLALSFAGGKIGLVGSVISGAFAGGFMLAGLAMLHHRVMNRAWKFAALWMTYTAIIFLFPLPLIVFLFAGLFETARTAPLSTSGPGPDNSNDQTN
ncbi:DUF2232 domain-containing protein [Hoeflea prorocentri]|uniref:DUF2232 domain-containing protein n=1 Tax=Hoeflea prorocentri TaxID=1922333 RepID=A0A9X3UID9_9HYPH|nr:DUF2232 domain-containing protein [Hoeflea prorocentri]MCY6381413.1 DUF2232 domain-containing protein [Hoeflea prorocentri]MDA5399213.1 DUF2232 domain-containing protein [Hoeflea prorocentri]